MTFKGRTALVLAIVAVIATGAWLAPAKAQATRNDDVLPALLVEVKGLRAAMEQMAAGSTQAQLLVGRLQLQEGRVTAMIRRLDTVHDSLASARREFDQINGAIQMLEKEKDTSNEAQEKEREGLFVGIKSQFAAAKANVERLSAEELQLTADIATEQQRWVAINQRLDELERTLAKR